MEYRPLVLTIISAKDLKDVNLFSRMAVYAIVTVSNDPRSKQRISVDKEGGKNPTWKFPMKFSIPTSNLNDLVLHIQLKCQRTFGDRAIGEAHIPINELLDASSSAKFVSYQVRIPSGKPQGVLNLSYRFGDKVFIPAQKSHEPVMAHPAAMPVPSTAGAYPYRYPPPPAAYPAKEYGCSAPPPAAYPAAGYGYGAPPPMQGYGYPPQPAQGYGYGYPPPVMQQGKKKNKFGMGLGAGLLGGALGGMLIGDMISDSSDAYDTGYDAGFDDGGGFDF